MKRRIHNDSKKSLHFSYKKMLNTAWLKEEGTKGVKPSYRLRTEKQVLQWSLLAFRFGSVDDAISGSILTPNYPFLSLEGSHPDSFPSTAPFGFTAATYFLASALTSAFVGGWSDKYGRCPFLLACVGMSVFGAIAKYLARNSFWGFCVANFVNGLFSSTLTVALAYVSDVHPGTGRSEKDSEIGKLAGLNMLGVTGGGIVAILMQETGLFTPLFFGAALNAVFMYIYLVEPDPSLHFEETVEEEDKVGPTSLDKKVASNVMIGAIFDNIGSAGLFPMALSPLMLETFNLLDLLAEGSEAIMSETAYKWVTMLLATMVFLELP
jgi:MFS family permease